MFEAGGKIRLWYERDVDLETEVAHQVTNADVEDGIFVYGRTGLPSRYNFVIVNYNDPDNFFQLVPEPVEDPIAIDRQGRIISKETTKFGCCRRSEAIREGRWELFSAQQQTLTVTFTARAIGRYMLPGEIVQVGDYRLSNIRYEGLVKAATFISIDLDAPINLLGSQCTISVTLPSGKVEKRNLVNTTGSYSTLNVTVPFSELPYAEASWIVATEYVQPQHFRILNVEPAGEPGKYEITAIVYKEGKQEYIENGIEVVDRVNRLALTVIVIKPSVVTVATSQNALVVSFGAAYAGSSPDPTVTSYTVEYSTDRITWVGTQSIAAGTYEFVYVGLPPGTYAARVSSFDLAGRYSDWTESIAPDALIT